MCWAHLRLSLFTSVISVADHHNGHEGTVDNTEIAADLRSRLRCRQHNGHQIVDRALPGLSREGAESANSGLFWRMPQSLAVKTTLPEELLSLCYHHGGDFWGLSGVLRCALMARRTSVEAELASITAKHEWFTSSSSFCAKYSPFFIKLL